VDKVIKRRYLLSGEYASAGELAHALEAVALIAERRDHMTGKLRSVNGL
jgi:hypothetical protein